MRLGSWASKRLAVGCQRSVDVDMMRKRDMGYEVYVCRACSTRRNELHLAGGFGIAIFFSLTWLV
jgi:hypothetical protein